MISLKGFLRYVNCNFIFVAVTSIIPCLQHWDSYYIVLQTFATSSRLNIYHIASGHTGGKGLIDSRTLYGIDVRMKQDKGKHCTLEVTHQNSVLTILFSTQIEAQQWFIALKRMIGKGIAYFV